MPNQPNADGAPKPFPDRTDTAIAAKLAKHPGQYLRENEDVDWQEAASGASLDKNKTPPPAQPTACGSIIWVWNGKDYDEKSKNCKPSCTCDPVKPDITLDDMPVGAEFTKDC